MAFLLKSDEKIENDYTYELSGDEDDRLRLEYILVAFHPTFFVIINRFFVKSKRRFNILAKNFLEK